MEYFLITSSTEKKEVGHYIQTKGLPEGYTSKWFDSPNSMTKLSNDFFPEEQPDLIFELEEKAKLTDIISTSNITSRGLLVNKKVKDILEQFNLIQHRFYSAALYFKKEKFDYYWLHLVNISLDNIDFEESEFYTYNYSKGKLQDIKILNEEDYEVKLMQTDLVDLIKVKKLAIKTNSMLCDKDIFICADIHYNIVVTQKLLDALKQEKISGFKIETL